MKKENIILYCGGGVAIVALILGIIFSISLWLDFSQSSEIRFFLFKWDYSKYFWTELISGNIKSILILVFDSIAGIVLVGLKKYTD